MAPTQAHISLFVRRYPHWPRGLWQWRVVVDEWSVERRTVEVFTDRGAVRTTGRGQRDVLIDVLYALLEDLGAGRAEADA